MFARPDPVDRHHPRAARSPARHLRSLASDAAAALHRFLDWWLGELAACLPAGLRQRLTAKPVRLVVLLRDDRATLLLEDGGEPDRLGSLDLASGSDAGQRLRAILSARGLPGPVASKVETCIRIPAAKVLRTTLDLPLAAERNLDEVVSFELDRHTPFRADQVFCTARVLRRSTAAQRLDVEIMLVPRPVADEAIAAARQLGLDPVRLDVAEDEGMRSVSGNLLPANSVLSRQRPFRRVTAALAFAAAALAVVAVYLPIARLHQDAAAASRDVAAVKAAAALQREIADLRKEQRFLVDRKQQMPSVSQLLLETTRILPDDTSLSAWQVSGAEIQLGGTTRSAASLIGLLEQSHKFHDTTFRIPVTQDPVTGRETFYIVARIVEETPP